ncbi:hypothetical protein TSMEX_011695 [Taenia solium]|eukprot:TsM_000130800 transcript=TsM_000130800 gene=TsM_000130800
MVLLGSPNSENWRCFRKSATPSLWAHKGSLTIVAIKCRNDRRS